MAESAVNTKPKVATVSLLARVMYSDGTVASLMIEPQEVDKDNIISVSEEGPATIAILNKQSKAIAEHLQTLGTEELYTQATTEAASRRAAVHHRAEAARDTHASKQGDTPDGQSIESCGDTK